MELRFWMDAETGLPHIYDHGVTEEEVQQVLTRPGNEFPGTEGSRIRQGQTEAGRYLQVVYAPDPGGESLRRHGIRLDSECQTSVSPPSTEKKAMSKKVKQKYPPGWDEERVRRVAEHYDNQTDEEAVAEIEAALADENQTMMSVPTELVPEIMKLINKKRPA